MSPVKDLDALEPRLRDAVQALAAGDADAGTTALADRALVELAGDPGASVDEATRTRIAAYLLGRQSPGRAAGTWRLLEEHSDAAAWATSVRDALGGLGGEERASLPTDDDARSPTDRARAGTAPAPDDDTLAGRRAARSRRRTARNAAQAAAELVSPFRSEAVEAQRTADDRVELPDFAPRPVRLALYALVVALLAGLAFTIVARVPVNAAAVVLVVRVPDAPQQQRLELLVLLPDVAGASGDAATGADVRRGDTLRVALPGEDRRTPTTIRAVSPGRLSPREVIRRYRLPVGQANLVTSPGYVAVAPLRTPPGRSARSYEGTTTTEASVQTGTQRIISLLF